MTTAELLRAGETMLAQAGIENSACEARWLLESVLDTDSAKLLAMRGVPVGKAESETYIAKIKERVSGRPLQYILGRWDFFGREFLVGEGVLIPRPETEQLVELALGYIREIKNPAVLDLCAGTGCIGLTIAKERPDSTVFLFEKYDGALDYLRKNTVKLGAVNARVIQGDIFRPENLPCEKIDLIVSNPPYVPTGEIGGLQREVGREPVTALDGGEDGLRYYYSVKEISRRLNAPVIAECGEGQADAVCEIFGNARVCEDFNSIKRFVIGE